MINTDTLESIEKEALLGLLAILCHWQFIQAMAERDYTFEDEYTLQMACSDYAKMCEVDMSSLIESFGDASSSFDSYAVSALIKGLADELVKR